MKRVLLEPAFVLHRRSYRESSFLIEVFTQQYGRISLIAKGARKTKGNYQALLQPFIPLLISFSGKHELMILSHVETNQPSTVLKGNCLFAGFYLNELLTYLLQKNDPHPNLFKIYHNSLQQLQATDLNPKVLRVFEKHLLEELGYGLLPKSDVSLQHSIVPDQYYRFVPEQGLVLTEKANATDDQKNIFSGKALLAIANESWDDADCLKDAKRLTRYLLAPLLGPRTLYSRQLFIVGKGESS